ncbi:MAG: hypothetical protein IT426_00405 [Pirellulales bacterium]|nr:hypothetical protein [Pirellulales bacterium]
MEATLERSQAEPKPQAAKPRSNIYDDARVAEAKALVGKMQFAVADAEREFAAATERGQQNLADLLLAGGEPGPSPAAAFETLRIARESLMLAQKNLDSEAVRASGEFYRRNLPRHGEIGMRIFEAVMELQGALQSEDAFIDEMRRAGCISTIAPIVLHSMNDVLRRLRMANLTNFGNALKARFNT